MPKIAEVINNVIVNIVMADTVSDAEQLHGRECIDLSNFPETEMPCIGMVRTDGIFSFPLPEIEE